MGRRNFEKHECAKMQGGGDMEGKTVKYGFIGIGIMGRGMAMNLVKKGFDVTVCMQPNIHAYWYKCSHHACSNHAAITHGSNRAFPSFRKNAGRMQSRCLLYVLFDIFLLLFCRYGTVPQTSARTLWTQGQNRQLLQGSASRPAISHLPASPHPRFH